MNIRIWTRFAGALAIVGALTGCHTPLPQFVPTVPPAPAADSNVREVESRFPRELHKATEAYRSELAKASDDTTRLAAADRLLLAVHDWQLRHPDATVKEKSAARTLLNAAEHSRTRLMFAIARAQAQQDARSAQTVAQALQAWAQEIDLLLDATKSSSFSEAEKQDMRRDAAVLRTAICRIELDDLIEGAHLALQSPVRFQTTMSTCQRALERLRAEASRPYWQDTERAWIAGQIDETKAAIQDAEEEFRVLVGQVRDEVRRAQSQMVNMTAKDDYKHANGLYLAERGKWLNWRAFSRPRDDTPNLVTSLRLCDRITTEERVDHPLRSAAADLHYTVLARFDNDERTQYRAALPLVPYTALSQYPRMSQQEIEAEAERRWLLRRQCRPTFPQDGPVTLDELPRTQATPAEERS